MIGAILGGYDLAYLVKVVIIVGALIAIGFIAMKAMGWTLPDWGRQMLVVVVVAFVAIVLIGILMSL